MKLRLLIIAGLFMTNGALAATDDPDRDAGTCTAYLVLTKREAGAEDAISLAADRQRAIAFARIFARRWQTTGPDLSGGDACRRIGVYPSLYKTRAGTV